MSACRWDPEHGYLTPQHWPACNGVGCPGCLPCEREPADPRHPDGPQVEVRHCEGRTGCTSHLHPDEASVCSRCIGRFRADLRTIEDVTALMLTDAVHGSSEALSLAGPAPHPGTVEARKNHLRIHLGETLGLYAGAMGIGADGHQLDIFRDDDWRHPYRLLTTWRMMLGEDYGDPARGRLTISGCRMWLDANAARIADDPDQDWALLTREVRECRQHLEAVHRDSRRPDRGAPCWLCPTPAPRLEMRRGHWCDDPTCEREHDATGARDTWVCPNNPREHWWAEAEYRYAVAVEARDLREQA